MAQLQNYALVPEFQRQATELERAVHQTVCHRRKFQYACTQFRNFVNKFAQKASAQPLSTTQIEAYRSILDILREYQQLFAQNMVQTWAHSALENKSSQVPSELCTMSSRLADLTAKLDSEASKSFDPTSPQWLQFHLLDLKPIETSFKQYVTKAGSENPASKLMLQKITSIEEFQTQYSSEVVSPDVQIFSPIPVYYQTWRLNLNDFELEKEAGNGVSAVVYYGHDKRNGSEVAVKRLKANRLAGSKLQSFQREVVILATATYPTLLKFVGATDTPPYCIVTEWMSNGSLYHDLHKFHRMDETMKTIAAYDIARGMKFLHSRQIIHRDLKSLNVLIDDNLLTRICDFGFSRQVGTGANAAMTKNVGTPHWMAPELLCSDTGYDNKVDVYAYAIVLWELLTNQLPYANMDPTQIVAQVMMKDLRPHLPPNLPEGIENLIKLSWDRDPTRRPSFKEIVDIFRTGTIYFPGTDVDILKRYISETSIQDNEPVTSETSKASKSESEEQQDTDESLDEILNKLKSENNENTLSEEESLKLWQKLIKHQSTNDVEKFSEAASYFVNSQFVNVVLETLRKIEPGKMTRETVERVLSLLSTGSEILDRDLVMIACKQNFAGFALTRAVYPEHMKIILEVLGRSGKINDLSLEKSVVDRSVQCLDYPDPSIVIAALRCLIGIQNVNKIPKDSIKIHLQSQNQNLKNAAYVAFTSLASTGEQISFDIIDMLVSNLKTEPLAHAVLAAACKNEQCAKYIMERILLVKDIPKCAKLRILTNSALFDVLRPSIMQVLNEMNEIPDKTQEVIDAIQNIYNYLEE